MDSRIREAKMASKKLRKYLLQKIPHSGTPGSCQGCKAETLLTKMDDAIALLTSKPEQLSDVLGDSVESARSSKWELAHTHTALLAAEPEPCEGARAVSVKVADMMTAYFLERYNHSSDSGIPPVRAIAEIVDAYASQAADKLAEDLQERIGRDARVMAELLSSIAYQSNMHTTEGYEQMTQDMKACLVSRIKEYR